MRKLKAYVLWRNDELLVAAESAKAAAELMGVSPRFLSQYGTQCHNEEDCRLALEAPGTVFTRNISSGPRPWLPRDAAPAAGASDAG